MSRGKNFLIMGEDMTRRDFLRGSLGAGLVLLAVGSAGRVLGACAPAPPTPDIPVTSSVDFNHSHKVTVPGADVDNPPAQKTYTSDGTSHTHNITLTKQQFESIANGQAVTVTSTAAGANQHTHTFTIQKM